MSTCMACSFDIVISLWANLQACRNKTKVELALMDNLRFKSLLQSTDLVGFVVGNCKTRAACRNGLKDGVYKSLQMQITGLETKVDPFFFFFFATSLFSLPSWI